MHVIQRYHSSTNDSAHSLTCGAKRLLGASCMAARANAGLAQKKDTTESICDRDYSNQRMPQRIFPDNVRQREDQSLLQIYGQNSLWHVLIGIISVALYIYREIYIETLDQSSLPIYLPVQAWAPHVRGVLLARGLAYESHAHEMMIHPLCLVRMRPCHYVTQQLTCSTRGRATISSSPHCLPAIRPALPRQTPQNPSTLYPRHLHLRHRCLRCPRQSGHQWDLLASLYPRTHVQRLAAPEASRRRRVEASLLPWHVVFPKVCMYVGMCVCVHARVGVRT